MFQTDVKQKSITIWEKEGTWYPPGVHMDIREGRLWGFRGLVVEVVIRREPKEIYALIRLFFAQPKKTVDTEGFFCDFNFFAENKKAGKPCVLTHTTRL